MKTIRHSLRYRDGMGYVEIKECERPARDGYVWLTISMPGAIPAKTTALVPRSFLAKGAVDQQRQFDGDKNVNTENNRDKLAGGLDSIDRDLVREGGAVRSSLLETAKKAERPALAPDANCATEKASPKGDRPDINFVGMIMAAARGFCTDRNRFKVMDSELVEDIVMNVSEYVRPIINGLFREVSGLTDRIAQGSKQNHHLREQVELEQMRLAACSTAALGYLTEDTPERYGSAALSDVLVLKRRYDQLVTQIGASNSREETMRRYAVDVLRARRADQEGKPGGGRACVVLDECIERIIAANLIYPT